MKDMKEWRREYRKRRRMEAKKAGICQMCFKEPAKENRTCCEECLLKKRLNTMYGSSGQKVIVMQMFQKQGGCCAICGDKPTRLEIDHDHVSLKLRGLLCSGCNNGLALFKDSSDRLMSAVKYLTN